MNIKLKLLALLAMVTGLWGCADKPPGCADPATLETLRGFITQETQRYLERESKDDPEGWIVKYTEGLDAQVAGIVTDGYVAEAKKMQCRGTLKLTTIDGKSMERPVSYSTQRTEDQKDGFVLEVDAFATIVAPTAVAAGQYYREQRWSGEWREDYACAGIDGATDGPQGPFKMPVTMVVADWTAKLERTTVGGGVEQLEGKLDPLSPKMYIELGGRGANSPDDNWRAQFVGVVEGLIYRAEGGITGPRSKPDGERAWGPLRKCTLNLTLTR